MNKYKRLVSNSIIFALGHLTVKGVQFIILPILTKYLLASEYGIIENMVTTLQDLIMPILTLGLAEALFRFSIDKENSQYEIFTNAVVVVLCGNIIFALGIGILYLISLNSATAMGQLYTLLLIPLFAFKTIKQLMAEFTRGLGKTIIYATSSIIESIVMLVLACVLIIVAKIGIYGYLVALISAPLVGIVYLMIIVKPYKFFKIKSFSRTKLSKMLRYSIPNISNNICWWVVQTSGRYLLVYLSVIAIGGGAASSDLYDQAWVIAGIFTAASKLPALINIVGGVFLQAWSLSSAQESQEEDRNEFYSAVFRYYSMLIMIVASVIILLVPYVSKILLQGDFYSGWVYSPLLVLGAVLGCFSSFFGAFFGAFYKSKYSMYSTFIGAGANLLVCGIFIPVVAKCLGIEYIGYVGSVAFLVSYFAIFVTRVFLSRKLVQLKTQWFKFASAFLINFVVAIIYTCNLSYIWIYGLIGVVAVMSIYFKDILYVCRKIKTLIDNKKSKV